MSENKGHENLDDDILECKRDILRENSNKSKKGDEVKEETEKIKPFEPKPIETDEIEALFEDEEDQPDTSMETELIDVEFEEETGDEPEKDEPVRSEKSEKSRGIENVYYQKTSVDRPEKESNTGGDVPKFDLGEQIMARQRDIASRKRKGPGQKTSKAEEKNKTSRKPGMGERNLNFSVPAKDEVEDRDGLISRIVAEDIRKLLSGNFLN